MRKLTAISLCFIFLISSLGLTVHYHHCKMMGSSVSLVKEEQGCCGGKKKMPSGCCENHSQRIEIKDDFLSSAAKIGLKPLELNLFIVPIVLIDLLPHQTIIEKKFYAYLDHFPPNQPVSLSILYRSILI